LPLNKDQPPVINKLAEERVLKGIFCLETAFTDTLGNFQGVFPDRKVLRHAVESYLHDLDRMKDFHNITIEDRHKRAAFTMLWIVRTHPVQLHTDANMTEALLLINEIFAIHAGLAHLNIAPSSISNTYMRNLVYILHYRPVSGELLASAMYLLECACLGKNP